MIQKIKYFNMLGILIIIIIRLVLVHRRYPLLIVMMVTEFSMVLLR